MGSVPEHALLQRPRIVLDHPHGGRRGAVGTRGGAAEAGWLDRNRKNKLRASGYRAGACCGIPPFGHCE